MAAKKAAKKKSAKKRPAKKTAAKKSRSRKPASETVRASLSDTVSPGETGRPTGYTPEMADDICFRLACGESLLKISRDEAMPHRFTISRWLMGIGVSQIDESELARFRDNYAYAREAYEHFVFESLEMVKEDVRPDKDHIARAKLHSDNMKWCLARRNRARYGDKADINLGGQADAPVEVNTHHEIDDKDAETLREIGRRLATGGTTK